MQDRRRISWPHIGFLLLGLIIVGTITPSYPVAARTLLLVDLYPQFAPQQQGVPVAGPDDSIYQIPFEWQGEATVSSVDLAAVAPPLAVIAAEGDFTFSYVPTEAGNVIRILLVRSEVPTSQSLQLAWRLTQSSEDPAIPAGSLATLTVWARLFSPPDGAQLVIRDQAEEWGSSSTTMQDIAWTQYEVTRAIGDDAREVHFGIDWDVPPENAWLEFRDMEVSIQPGIGPESAATLSPTDTPTPVATATPTATNTLEVPPTPVPIVVTPTPTAVGLFVEATPDDSIYQIPFEWQGEATVPSVDLAAVAPPLEVIAAEGDFTFSYVPTDAGNVIRILPVRSGEPISQSLQLAWRLVESSEDPASSVVTLAVWARLFSQPDGAQLVIRDQAEEWGSSSTTMQDIGWTQYEVTRTIGDDAREVLFGIDWDVPPENAWLEFRDMEVSIQPGIGPESAATLSPTDTPAPPTATSTPEVPPTPVLIIVTSTPTAVDLFAEGHASGMATEWANVLGAATTTQRIW